MLTSDFFVYLQQNNHRTMSNNQQNMMLNRLKAALAEQGKTNRLSEQLGKSENTISRWCANKVQPSITQLNEIAIILDVDLRSLVVSTKE